MLALPDEMRLFMCHDYGPNGRAIAWETTVADERAQNIHVGGGRTREEFVAMLPHCGMAEAVRIAEKLRALVAATPFLTVGTVSSSFGVAEFRPDEDLGAWVNRTDEALYAGKAAGRNAVRQAGTDRNP